MDRWRLQGRLFATPKGANDDWYWIYASVLDDGEGGGGEGEDGGGGGLGGGGRTGGLKVQLGGGDDGGSVADVALVLGDILGKGMGEEVVDGALLLEVHDRPD